MKYSLSLILSAVLLVSFSSQKASAQVPLGSYSQSGNNFLIAPSVFYYSGLRSRTSKDDKSYLVGELKLAYQVSTNIYLGAIYQHEQEEVITSGYSSATSNNTANSKRTSLGASLGYATETFHVFLSYFVSSKWNLDTVSSAGANQYDYDGSGFQIDLGYKIPLWGFFVGPQLSYKMFTYDELVTNGGSAAGINPKLEDTKLEPALVFYYFF